MVLLCVANNTQGVAHTTGDPQVVGAPGGTGWPHVRRITPKDLLTEIPR